MQMNRVLVGLGWLGALTLGTGAARAQTPGIELGLRLGYGVALGSAVPGSDLAKNIAGEVPLWADLGYRLNSKWMIGAYGLYGFGFSTGDEERLCETYHVDCSLHDLRLGAQVQYHLMPLAKLDPWLGLGLGYEWLIANGASGGRSASATLRGWEFVNLQGGLDWVVGAGFALGPFVSLSFAQYQKISSDCSGASCGLEVNESLDDRSLHNWVVVGLRGTFLCGTRGHGAPCPLR